MKENSINPQELTNWKVDAVLRRGQPVTEYLISSGYRSAALRVVPLSEFPNNPDPAGLPKWEDDNPEADLAIANLAAAPELLEALENLAAIVDAAQWGKPWPGRPHAQMDAARAAIAAAKGEA